MKVERLKSPQPEPSNSADKNAATAQGSAPAAATATVASPPTEVAEACSSEVQMELVEACISEARTEAVVASSSEAVEASSSEAPTERVEASSHLECDERDDYNDDLDLGVLGSEKSPAPVRRRPQLYKGPDLVSKRSRSLRSGQNLCARPKVRSCAPQLVDSPLRRGQFLPEGRLLVWARCFPPSSLSFRQGGRETKFLISLLSSGLSTRWRMPCKFL